MSFVFDNGPFSSLFRNYYHTVFPTMWVNFDNLVDNGEIVSVREVRKEIDGSSIETLRDWAAGHDHIFELPNAEEAKIISAIYSVPQFRQNIDNQKLLKGGLIADPFVIAKAALAGKTVVTTEKFKPHSAKIPNICKHFGVNCMSLQEFMESQKWKF